VYYCSTLDGVLLFVQEHLLKMLGGLREFVRDNNKETVRSTIGMFLVSLLVSLLSWLHVAAFIDISSMY
jgi:hypothetical protein